MVRPERLLGKEATVTEIVSRSARQIDLTETFAAHNYDPLPVVASHGDGCWVIDVDGRRYLDCLAAYSALNFGHRHPALIEAARTQLDRLTLTSRAFHNDQLGPFCRDLAALAGMECVLPMNTGVEAVETAIKVARRWGYDVKGVPEEQAQIVVMTNNFHGRTTTVISFPTITSRAAASARSRPGLLLSRSGMRKRWLGQSRHGPLRCCWSQCRAKPAFSCRRRHTLRQYGVSVPTLACCSLPTRFSRLGTVRDDIRLRTRGRRTRRLHVG
jgi:Aminotransferase class-III